jgi:adenylate cyclase
METRDPSESEIEQAYRQAALYARDLARVYAEEKARREELESAHQLLSAVYKSVPGGLVVLDDAFAIEQANPEFLRLVEMSAEEITGRPLTEVLLAEELHTILMKLQSGEPIPDLIELSVIQPVRDSSAPGVAAFERRSFLMTVSRLDSKTLPGWVMVLLDQTARKRLYDAFGRYVNPEMAEQVIRHGVNLGGDMVNASALFADIRGFTTLSERMSAPAVVEMLNRYFSAIIPVLRGEGGYIYTFGGDSVLAVFGAPVPYTDHVERAVRAALAMRERLREFNARREASGEPTLRIGIGIDSGLMVAGSIGSPDRMEYTVIGDPVNTASRIDDLNRTWGTDILISERVYRAVAGWVDAEAMPPTMVQGKAHPVQVYALR